MADLISGRAAGVQVLKSAGTTGTGTRIRIRGSNSISLSNEPLYYIDGIRLESSAFIQHPRHRRLRRRRPPDQRPLPAQRPESRRHRVDRDREGPGRRHPLRHSGLERRGANHHQEGPSGRPKWNFFAEAAGSATTILIRSTSSGATTTAATGVDYDYFCLLQYRAGRALHPDLGAQVLAAGDGQHPPAQDRLAPAVRRQRVGRQRVRDLLHLRRIRERGRRLSPVADRGGLGPERGRERARQPDPSQHPGTVEHTHQSRRQRLAATPTSAPRSGISPATPGSSRTTTAC